MSELEMLQDKFVLLHAKAEYSRSKARDEYMIAYCDGKIDAYGITIIALKIAIAASER